ncbi:nucleotide exchange factor GrpE [Leifsonia naganoensis]|uniref:Protein GrpE n=1 Tax=Leifsonia naganoensis TaxID=150025 RepID=A0A853DPS1_9MICO|nr:nucleotide exchange factor GrpE [Leifsonia naganoensis]NYK09499.1 molecular chaperone GrpE [Leifsonia naganoensis]
MDDPETRSTDTERPEESAASPSDELVARLADVEDRWRRAAADLDNSRKRAARELASARDAERVRAAAVFLPVVDGLQDAVTYAEGVDTGLAAGVGSIRELAIAALERLGFPRIDTVGVPFDPRIHEVVSVIDRGEQPPRTVVAVTRLGFGSPEHLLRPAGVVVTAAEE